MAAPVEALLAEVAADLLSEDLAATEETWTDVDRVTYDVLHRAHGDDFNDWPIPALREGLSILCRVTGVPDTCAPAAPSPRVVMPQDNPPTAPLAPTDPLAHVTAAYAVPAPAAPPPAPPFQPRPLMGATEFLAHLRWALDR